MVKFISSTLEDIPQIQDWTERDVYHLWQNTPEWWITGSGLLSFRLDDEEGPICYVRVDTGEYAELSTQFAPVEVVSKRRVVSALLEAFPKLAGAVKASGSKGIIFNSISPSLIVFMAKLGFIDAGNDSYKLTF